LIEDSILNSLPTLFKPNPLSTFSKMKTAASVLALAIAVRAHYTFDRLEVNGEQVGQSWQYIREHTRGYMPTKGQQILENDFRCQPGGGSGANTDVYTVGTGDKVAFLGAYGMNSIEHPGTSRLNPP
jgi:hypothetical protein